MGRLLLAAVDESKSSKVMFRWLLENDLRADDTLHLLHVCMRAAAGGALPGTDYFDQAHPVTAQRVVQSMLQAEYIGPLQAAFPHVEPVVHIVQASLDAKTIGRIVCQKAEQLNADLVVIGASSRHRNKIIDMLAGCVVTYCKQHCAKPLQVVVQGDGPGAAAAIAAGQQPH